MLKQSYKTRILKLLYVCLFATVMATSVTGQNRASLNLKASLADVPRGLSSNIVFGQTNKTSALLQETVSFKVENETIHNALLEVANKAGLKLSYSAQIAPLDKKTTLKFENVSVYNALWKILEGTGLRYAISQNQHLIIIKPDFEKVINEWQNGAIYGTVVDARDNEPLVGANVFIEELTKGASVNLEGEYEITRLEDGVYTLVVRFIGYKNYTQKVVISGGERVEINVKLERQSIGLDAVVITATGETRAREVGTSLARLSSSDFEEASVSNAQDILTGSIPGVSVLANSGNPGAGGTIRLRGNNSISQNNNPIIYVDGIRISGGDTPTHQASRQSASPFNDINPNDIASIDIVKGAAATTLYGTEASGGVIRVTTKQGQSGVAQWNAGVTTGFNNIGHFGPKEGNPTGLFMGRCRGDGLESYNGVKFEDVNCPSSGSWLQNGLVQRYSLNVSSGVENFTYYLSGEYKDEEGVINGGGGSRGTGFRGNFQFTPAEDLTLTFNSSYNRNKTDWVPSGNNGDGFVLNVTRGPGGNFTGASGCNDPNVICVDNGEILESDNYSTREHFTNSLVIGSTIGKNLSNRVTLGYDYNISELVSTQYFGYRRTPLGQQEVTNWSNAVLSLEYLGTFDHQIVQDLGLKLNWGGQIFNNKTITTSLFSEGFSGPQEPTLTSGARTNITGDSRIEITTGGVFGQATIDLKDQLFLVTGVRVDGHSAFGANYGLQVYPKVSLSYVLSDYDFWPTEWWNTLNLRAAVGQSGQAPGAFDAVRTWRPIAGENGQPGFTPNQIGNPDLGPEKSTEFETGFMAGFADGRITTDVTYYNQTTTDALIPVPAIASEGFISSQVQNVGEVRNSGIEVQLNLNVLNNPNINWDVRAGFSKEKSEAVNLGETDELTIEFFARTFIKEGYPVPAVFGAKITNPDEYADPIYEEDQYYGPSYPDKSITLGTTFRILNGVVVDALGEFKLGGYMINGTAYQNGRRGTWPPCYEIQNRNISEVTASDRAKCALNSGNVSARYDHWIESTDFFKLRHVSISYNLPQKWLGGQVKSATVRLTARNLFTITDYSGDPEVDDFRNSLARRDYYSMPTYRSFLASLNFSF